jgi:hypothetical protein
MACTSPFFLLLGYVKKIKNKKAYGPNNMSFASFGPVLVIAAHSI